MSLPDERSSRLAVSSAAVRNPRGFAWRGFYFAYFYAGYWRHSALPHATG